MKQTPQHPQGREQLDIELADNGIILRDCDDPDSVFLALYDRTQPPLSDRDEIYRVIGRDIFTWLIDVLAEKHPEHITTGFHLDITATLQGRPTEK